MQRDHLLLGVVMICVLSGILSPYTFLAGTLVASFWLPELASISPSILAYLSSIIGSTLVLMLSGVPAAIYERVTGAETSNTTSMLIWMGGAALLSLPMFYSLG